MTKEKDDKRKEFLLTILSRRQKKRIFINHSEQHAAQEKEKSNA